MWRDNCPMRWPVFSEPSGIATPAAMLVAARIANIALGLAVIPVLLHFLGTQHFAAWALLLAIGAALSLLDLSMPLTYVRAAAPLIHGGRLHEAAQVSTNSLCVVAASFSLAAAPLFAATPWLINFVHLPDGRIFNAEQLVALVFAAVAIRALLQFGALRLNAARRFGALAVSSFSQSVASNAAAALTAFITERLEYTVIAFWSAQLVVLLLTGFVARALLTRPSASFAKPTVAGMRDLLRHALRLQVYDWAQVVSYQFDKFLIAAFVGLPAVATYEVGNRSVLALRSIPSSGIDSFLATAAIGQADREALWREYERATKLAIVAVFIFILAPLAVAPMFLYAWTGELGYEARCIVLVLAVGAAFSIVALPAGAMVQAAGRPDLQARAAIASLVVNIPLSYFLVLNFALVGVAAGTAIAMCIGAMLLIADAHLAYGQRAVATFRLYTRYAKLILCIIALAAVCWTVFDHFMRPPAAVATSAGVRVSAAVGAVAIYAFIIATMVVARVSQTTLGGNDTRVAPRKGETK